MDNPEYENFLLEIADKVEALVEVLENRKRFEQHSCDLGKKHAAYKEAKERGAKQMPYEPLSGFLSVLAYDKDNPDEPPQLKIDEALAYYYFSLATIHDKMREEYIPIHNDSRAKQLANTGVWPIIENLCVDKQFIIRTALGHVEADLSKTPAEIEPQAEDMIIATIKKISKIIEKLDTLKTDKKKYSKASLQFRWHQGNLRNSLWARIVQPLVDEIEIDLVELWDCILENTEWNKAGIENAIRTRKHDEIYRLDRLVHELEKIKHKMEVTEQKDERSKIMITAGTSKENWEAIRSEYDISKKDFGKKINFVSDSFKRKIIFRDVEHAFVLASQAFSKPALILAGGVIEELLRLYLEHKNIKLKNKRFVDYIKACEDNRLMKRGVSRLSDSIRDFRNLVHLANEETKKHTISKATAKGSVSSIFTIANDF